jgi:asparagine synthetase B (glutamine-hydrolysing)
LGHKNVQKASPNTTYIINIDDGDVKERPVYSFDLNQHKTTHDDWCAAFSRSIAKRTKNTDKNFFLGLSSGYDSGAIFSELLKCKIPFYTFTMTGSENQKIIDERIKLMTTSVRPTFFERGGEKYNISHAEIVERTEPFAYTVHSSSSDYNERWLALVDDDGSNNFATLCRMARQKNCKICLSGSGADEIISDYGFNGKKMYQHSNFGGLFPDELKIIFPWASFYGSTMESYIAKEEYVGGSYGIEMRYPFLDKEVVQEFLWITAGMKNAEYKAPIDYYLKKNGIPFALREKKGFG